MKASEIITEVFQPGKTNWEWLFRGSEEVRAKFIVGDREYRWDAFTMRGHSKKWEIQFRIVRKLDDSPGMDLYGTTGTGNAADVMSTAVDITRAFLQDYGLDKIEELTFNAKEDSRIALYAKMIKRLLPGWDLHTIDFTRSGDGMEYHLTDRRAYDKPENKLNEVGDTFYDVDQTGVHKPSFNSRLKREKIGLPRQGVSTFFEFTTASGTKYKIEIIQNKLKQGGSGVNVIFTNQTAISKGNDSIGITNDGDAIKVFSTVKTVLAKYLKEHPEIIIVGFSAKTAEPSRVKLYQMFAKQFQRWFPQFTNFKSRNNGDFTAFGVSIPQKQKVAEVELDEAPLPPDWDPQQFHQRTTTFKSRLAYALERAKKLGTGSSRVAMTIEYEGRPTALKVAKNAKGIAQNKVEIDILEDGYASQLGILIPIIDYDKENYDPQWLQTEQAEKANEQQLCRLMGCDSLLQLVRFGDTIAGKYRGQTAQSFIERLVNDGKLERDIERMTEYANTLADLANSFEIELADFARAANWGLYQGKPIIIDVGFNSNVMKQYY